jgi:hypothetical protein
MSALVKQLCSIIVGLEEMKKMGVILNRRCIEAGFRT